MGCILGAFTFNRDAAAELRRRGVDEGRIFHAEGWQAVRREWRSRGLVVAHGAGVEEPEDTENEADGGNGGPIVRTKSRLILERLYPLEPDALRQTLP